jgi:hypothetical protein
MVPKSNAESALVKSPGKSWWDVQSAIRPSALEYANRGH